MEIQILDVINLMTTFTAGAVGWVVGRRKQKNDFLAELQSSVDMLASKNKLLLDEVVQLRVENSKLRYDVEALARKFEGKKTIPKKADPNATK